MKLNKIKYLLCFLPFLVVTNAESKIKVIDGDSIVIGEREIRLSGLDAPEYNQMCKNAQGEDYACGQKSLKALRHLVGPDLKCKMIVKDKYKREVSTCESRGININKKMVEIGWAVAYTRYTKEYSEVEKLAKKNKIGIWQGRFMKPELYRILNKKD